MTDFFEDKISERLGGKGFGKSTEIYKFEMIKGPGQRQKKHIRHKNSSILVWENLIVRLILLL